MTQSLNQAPYPHSPAARFFLVVCLGALAIIAAMVCLTMKRQANLQREVAANYDEKADYLVPADCGTVPPGQVGKDYVRVTLSPPHRGAHGREICLYNATAFDRLFVSVIKGDRRVVHLDQARRMGVNLLAPG